MSKNGALMAMLVRAKAVAPWILLLDAGLVVLAVLAMASQVGMLVKAGDQWVHLSGEVAAKVLGSASVEPRESQTQE